MRWRWPGYVLAGTGLVLGAVQAHRILQSDYSIAIHFGTFRLADDARNDPPEALADALIREAVSDQSFLLLGFGEGRSFNHPRPAQQP